MVKNSTGDDVVVPIAWFATDVRLAFLQLCFGVLPPVTGRKPTSKDCAAWISEQPGAPHVVEGTIAGVRSGGRGSKRPSYELLVWIARYFSLPADVWINDELQQKIMRDLSRLESVVQSDRGRLAGLVGAADFDKLDQIRRILDESESSPEDKPRADD